MPSLSLFPFLWSQAVLPGIPAWLRPLFTWFFIFGEPGISIPGLLGALITWLKVISLFCLLGWAASWLSAAFKERVVGSGYWFDIVALAAVVGGVAAVALHVNETTQTGVAYRFGGVSLVSVLAIVCGGLLFLWLESALWRTIRRLGRATDLSVLVGIHLALGVGIGMGFLLQRAGVLHGNTPDQPATWRDALSAGARLSATYMGFVVLARVAGLVVREVLAVRWRRLFSIALVGVRESNRRMWAPWVVITLFAVILAFTHWFLLPPRPAEMGRLFVGTLMLLCSLLLTVMITILTPLSLPYDIQNQTIYTVVTKPVRRIELIWGRMIGFMAIVSVLIFVFWFGSLAYLWRNVRGAIRDTEIAAVKAAQSNRLTEAKALREQADQMRSRMAARMPVKGSLTFIDSRGNPHIKGIDVGQEQSMREPRSHIEGATPATAIWHYGVVPDPFDSRVLLDRRIPVDLLLARDSIEGLLNESYELQDEAASAEREKSKPNLPAARASELARRVTSSRAEFERIQTTYKALKAEADAFEAKADAAERAGQPSEAESFRRQAGALHSPPIALEMTFNIFRTTKGRPGEPVYAEIEATNPRTGAPYRNIFAIHEYYTNKQFLPSSILAGSHGALKVEIRCVSPTQYLGMAESDLYVLAQSGNFGWNFAKGLFGVWLQAMVLTAIGVCAGTFLSWPVALLATISFFVAGQIAFSSLLEFTRDTLLGGGPFESLVRLLSHQNMMSDLAPTLGVVTARTLDSLVMPVMSRLVYIVPNFSALDVSNTVADGFAVSWGLILSNLLLACAYALPFSIAGYFILKNREVAA